MMIPVPFIDNMAAQPKFKQHKGKTFMTADNKAARRLFGTGHLPGAMKHALRGRQPALQVSG